MCISKECLFWFWGWKALYISVNFIWSRTLFNATISLLIFCLEDVSIFDSGVWKSSTIIVLLSISFLKSSKIFFMYLILPFSIMRCLSRSLFMALGFFKYIFIDYAITVVPFPPLHSTPSGPPPPSHIPPYSSCPWVIHISSLASTFPILFLPSPCRFATYHLCYLFSVSFPPLSPSHSPVDNPPCDLHFCGSVPVLVVCLVCFCFCFRCGC